MEATHISEGLEELLRELNILVSHKAFWSVLEPEENRLGGDLLQLIIETTEHIVTTGACPPEKITPTLFGSRSFGAPVSG